MSELLAQWVNQEVHVSLPVNNFEEDFKNGYLLGEILYRLQFMSYQDFGSLKDSVVPRHLVTNYEKVSVALKSLGIKIGPGLTQDLMDAKPGVAVRLVYAVRMAYAKILAGKQQNHQFQVLTSRSLKHDPNIPNPTIPPSKLHPAQRVTKSRGTHNTKPSYEKQSDKEFDRTVVNAAYYKKNEKYYNNLLSRFTDFAEERERMLTMMKDKDKAVEDIWKADFRADRLNVMRTNAHFRAEWNEEQIAQWQNNMDLRLRRKRFYEDFEKKDKSEAKVRHRNNVTEEARHAMNQLDSFESKLPPRPASPENDGLGFNNLTSRTGSNTGRRITESGRIMHTEGGSNTKRSQSHKGETNRSKMTGTNRPKSQELGNQGPLAPIEHLQKLEKQLPGPAEQILAAEQKFTEIAENKEVREASMLLRSKRRRAVISDSAPARAVTNKMLVEGAVTRCCEQEQKVEDELWRSRQYKTIARENKRYLDQQYEERQQQRQREILARDVSLYQSVLEQHEISVQMEEQRYDAIRTEQLHTQHKHNYTYCNGLVTKLLDLVVKTSKFKALGDQSWVSTDVWKEWMLLFVRNFPLLSGEGYVSVPSNSNAMDAEQKDDIPKEGTDGQTPNGGLKSGRSSRTGADSKASNKGSDKTGSKAGDKKDPPTSGKQSRASGAVSAVSVDEEDGEETELTKVSDEGPTYQDLIDVDISRDIELVKEPSSTASVIDENTFNHYLHFTAEFSPEDVPGEQTPQAPLTKRNPLLGAIVEKVVRTVSGPLTPLPAPSIPRAALSIIILGCPYSGKRTQAAFLAEMYNLKLLNIDNLLQSALQEDSELKDEIDDCLFEGRVLPDSLYVTLVLKAIEAVPLIVTPADELRKKSEALEARTRKAEAEETARKQQSALARKTGTGSKTPSSDRAKTPRGEDKTPMVDLKEQAKAAEEAKKADPAILAMAAAELGNRKEEVASEREFDEDQEGDDNLPNAHHALPVQKPKPKVYNGWVLIGFPYTLEQAKLLEKGLSGYEPPASLPPGPPVLTNNASEVVESRIAPPPAPTPRQGALPSAIDLVFRLDCEQNRLIRRAIGRRVNPQNNTYFHLQRKPPDEDAPVKELLQEIATDVDLQVKLPELFSAYHEQEDALAGWFQEFGSFRPVFAVPEKKEVLGVLKHEIEHLQKKKHAADEIMLKAYEYKMNESIRDSQAKEMKRAEVMAWDPAVDDIDHPHADHDAHMSDETRPGTVGSNGKTPLPGAKASKPQSTRATPRGESSQSKPMTVLSVDTPRGTTPSVLGALKMEMFNHADIENNLSKLAEFADVNMARLLADRWIVLESNYTAQCKAALRDLRLIRWNNMQQCASMRRAFRCLLRSEDGKMVVLDEFQHEFNTIHYDLRMDSGTKEELHLRTDELKEKLDAIIEERKTLAETEYSNIREDPWLETQCSLIVSQYVGLMQSEIDRYHGAIKVTQDVFAVLQDRVIEPDTDFDVPVLPLFVDPNKDSKGGKGAKAAKKPVKKEAPKKKDTKAKGGAAKGSNLVEDVVGPLEEKLAVLEENKAFVLDHMIEVDDGGEDTSRGVKKGGKPAGKADKKGGKNVGNKTPQPMTPDQFLCQSQYKKIVETENSMLIQRVASISRRATSELTALTNYYEKDLFVKMLDGLIARFEGETNAVNTCIYVIKTTIEEEQPLYYQLAFEGTEFCINRHIVMMEIPTLPDWSPFGEIVDPKNAQDFTPAQLTNLYKKTVCAGSGNIILTTVFAEMLHRLACQQYRAEPGAYLPANWSKLEVPQIKRIISLFDPLDTVILDWREFLIALLLKNIPSPTTLQLDCMLNDMRTADSDNDGQLTEEEFLGVNLWWDDYLAAQAPKGQPSKIDTYKKLVFTFFSTKVPLEKPKEEKEGDGMQPIEETNEEDGEEGVEVESKVDLVPPGLIPQHTLRDDTIGANHLMGITDLLVYFCFDDQDSKGSDKVNHVVNHGLISRPGSTMPTHREEGEEDSDDDDNEGDEGEVDDEPSVPVPVVPTTTTASAAQPPGTKGTLTPGRGGGSHAGAVTPRVGGITSAMSNFSINSAASSVPNSPSIVSDFLLLAANTHKSKYVRKDILAAFPKV